MLKFFKVQKNVNMTMEDGLKSSRMKGWYKVIKVERLLKKTEAKATERKKNLDVS